MYSVETEIKNKTTVTSLIFRAMLFQSRLYPEVGPQDLQIPFSPGQVSFACDSNRCVISPSLPLPVSISYLLPRSR